MAFKIKTNLLSGFYSVLCGVALLLSISGTAHAQAPSACDPEYMDALEARAYLEGQREIAHNKDIIAKPDSVLEYSCFHGFLEELAQDAENLFSESQDWGIILQPDSMDIALTELVGNALEAYIDINFEHGYINGRGANIGMNDIPVGTVAGSPLWPGSAICNHMINAWNEVRSLNFQNAIPGDEYHTFEWYAANDPRNSAVRAIHPDIDGYVDAFVPDIRTQDAIDTAYNVNAPGGTAVPYQIANPGFTDAAPYFDDPILTFLVLLDPGVCTAGIPTGVTVVRSNGLTYAEHVCSNPGCYPGTGGGCN